MIDDRCWGSGARLPLTVVTFIGHMSLLPYRSRSCSLSASGCAAAESLAKISKVSKRTSHQSSAGCRLLSSTFATQMAILWSSSRCSTAQRIRASLDHFPSGAKRLNQPLEPTPKVFARHGGRAGRCNKTVEGGLVEKRKAPWEPRSFTELRVNQSSPQFIRRDGPAVTQLRLVSRSCIPLWPSFTDSSLL
jgi:hypothetical protein